MGMGEICRTFDGVWKRLGAFFVRWERSLFAVTFFCWLRALFWLGAFCLFAGGFVLQERCLLLGVFLLLGCFLFRELLVLWS